MSDLVNQFSTVLLYCTGCKMAPIWLLRIRIEAQKVQVERHGAEALWGKIFPCGIRIFFCHFHMFKERAIKCIFRSTPKLLDGRRSSALGSRVEGNGAIIRMTFVFFVGGKSG